MLKCVDITLRGRCAEAVYPSRVDGDSSPRCYYHSKLHAGLIGDSSGVDIEDIE